MKRYMAILGFVFVGILAGLLVRGIPIVLHVNAGGEIPRGSQNGDVNGDSMLDMSDAVFLLIHLFNGGPEPIACADSDEIWEEVRAIEGEVNGLGGPLASIAKSLAYESCKNRHDRFVEHGDGTVTDRLTRLMWKQEPESFGGWETSMTEAENSNFSGHEDWRLPTSMELQSIFTMGKEADGAPTGVDLIYPVLSPTSRICWSSTQAGAGRSVWCINFRYDPQHEIWTQGSPNQTRHWIDSPLLRRQRQFLSPNAESIGCYLVRDITPEG